MQNEIALQSRISVLIILVLLIISCNNKIDSNSYKKESDPILQSRARRPVALLNGKITFRDGKKYLFGGEKPSENFDISNSELIDSQLHYGIGREQFPALLQPLFVSVAEADSLWENKSRFLLVKEGKVEKAYAVKDLSHHEVVNDQLNGRPIMAAYCILADLAAIYERKYGDEELTFALSGYTYYDDKIGNGMDGFVFWDRETESLWWPLIGKAVSGPLKDVRLKEMDKKHWREITWREIKRNYPRALILKSGQDYERPVSWPKLKNLESIRSNF